MNARRAKSGDQTDASTVAAVLRLYVAGDAPNSLQALANLEAICREHIKGDYDLEIIDVLKHPARAMAAGVLVTPTLTKAYPLPAAQIVGNLSDKLKVLLAIGIRSQQDE